MPYLSTDPIETYTNESTGKLHDCYVLCYNVYFKLGFNALFIDRFH